MSCFIYNAVAPFFIMPISSFLANVSKQPCVPIVVKWVFFFTLFVLITHSSLHALICSKDYMLQLNFANIDFFIFVFFSFQLVACFSLNTFQMAFCLVLLLSRENLNMHFVPFINTFTLFFGFFGLSSPFWKVSA